MDGVHLVYPGPNFYHQPVLRHLQHPLLMQTPLKGLGINIYAPWDLPLSPFDVLRPDGVFFSTEHKALMTPFKMSFFPIC